MVDWEAVVRDFGPQVWRTIHRLVDDAADADDVFQETLLAAFELARRQPIRHWPATLRRLATARAIDRLRQRYRRNARTDEVEWDAVAGALPSPSELAEATELAGRLREALTQLPADQAEVFCLNRLEGFSYRQIAAEMAISVDSVGVLLHRARGRLRQLVAQAV
jgi:RNA polymerase sigma-70 factor (ECF subfamily)